MITPKELALLLKRVNVKDVARLSGFCAQTVYRLRRQNNEPMACTVQRLEAAARQLLREASDKATNGQA